jgi:WD40 repeat protein
LFLLGQVVRCQQLKITLPIGHTSSVIKSVFSPKGRYILTASWDKTARLWNPVQQKLLHTFSYHTGVITDVAFNHTESLVAVSSKDSSFSVWDIPACTLRFAIKVRNAVTHVEFNKYQNELLVQYGDSAKLYSIITGKIQWQAPIKIDKIKYSTDYKQLICQSFYNTDIILFDTENKNMQGTIYKWHKLRIVGFEQTGPEEVISASLDSTLVRWDRNGKMLESQNVGFPVSTISISGDGKHAVLTSKRGYAELWDLGRMEKLDIIQFEDDVRFLNGDSSVPMRYSKNVFAKFLPNSNELIVAADNVKEIQQYIVGNKLYLQKTYKSNHKQIEDLTVSPDGKGFVLSADQNPVLFDIRRGTDAAYLMGHTHSPWFIKPVLSDSFLLAQSPVTKVEIWDMRHQKLQYTLASKISDVQGVSCSPSEKMFATISQSNQISVWNTSTGELLQQINLGRKWKGSTLDGGPPSNFRQMEGVIVDTFLQTNIGLDKGNFSNNENLFAAFASNNIQIPIIDLKSNKLKFNIILDANGIDNLFFSPDSKWLAILSWHHTIVLVNIEKRSLLFLEGNGEMVRHARFNKESTQLVAADETGELFIWDLGKGEDVSTHTLEERPVALLYANDGRTFLAITEDTVVVYDASTYKKIKTISLGKQRVSNAELLPNTPDVLLHYLDGTKGLLTIETGLQQSLSKQLGRVSHFSTTQKNDKIITESGSILRTWNFPAIKNIVSYFSIDSASYFSFVNEGYYLTDPAASKLLHYVTKDLKVITFEQLDVKYNRPDKVLEATGNTDTALINSYRKAWEKRIKKLGIDTTQFRDGYSVPEADFINRDSIDYEQKNGSLRLHIKGIDSTYKLDRFNIWVNEAPLFGQRGVSIKQKNNNSIDTTLTIQLSQGENKIETSITNANGTESYRMPLYVNYTPPSPQQEIAHFIGIGIDKFADNKFNLQYSSKDIRDLAIKLKEKYKDNIIIDTLFNENVTTANVKKLKAVLLKTSVNDKVIVSYSGHGLLSKDYDYYLSTYSVNFNKPEENGLPYDELENLLDSIPARKKLMLIDACHSGEVDKEEMQRYAQSENKLDTGVKGARKLELNNNAKLGMKNSFELMQNLFVNVGKSTGATIISAAAGTQFALERSDLKNGVFTYCILEEMKKNIPTTISQLKKTVGEQVEKMTNGLQKPTSRNENVAVDWHVW